MLLEVLAYGNVKDWIRSRVEDMASDISEHTKPFFKRYRILVCENKIVYELICEKENDEIREPYHIMQSFYTYPQGKMYILQNNLLSKFDNLEEIDGELASALGGLFAYSKDYVSHFEILHKADMHLAALMLRTKGYQLALDSGYDSSLLAKFVHDLKGRSPANNLDQLVEDVPLVSYVATYLRHNRPVKLKKDRLHEEFSQYCKKGGVGFHLLDWLQILRNTPNEKWFVRELHSILDALYMLRE
jgi:hypothetical protein